MRHTVLLEQSEEGYAVSVPALRGCHSRRRTEEEALENIADAIREHRNVPASADYQEVEELARIASEDCLDGILQASGAKFVVIEV